MCHRCRTYAEELNAVLPVDDDGPATGQDANDAIDLDSFKDENAITSPPQVPAVSHFRPWFHAFQTGSHSVLPLLTQSDPCCHRAKRQQQLQKETRGPGEAALARVQSLVGDESAVRRGQSGHVTICHS